MAAPMVGASRKGSAMRKKVATVAVIASLLGGAGASVVAPQVASARSGAVRSAATSTATARTSPAWVTTALSKLVTAGTLTQTQANAVSSALLAAQPAKGPGGPGHGPGRPAELTAAATALGITDAQLRTELQAGKSIAAVATAKGVAVQSVINAMVAAAKRDLAAAVTAGRLTQAQADDISSTLVAHITDHVNGVRPAGGPGRPGKAATTAA